MVMKPPSKLRTSIFIVINSAVTIYGVHLVLTENDPYQRLRGAGIALALLATLPPNLFWLRKWQISSEAYQRLDTVTAVTGTIGSALFLSSFLVNPALGTSEQHIYKLLYIRFGVLVNFAAMSLLALLGLILHEIKKRRLILYAYAEIAFALTSCYVAADRSRERIDLPTVLTICAAVYVIVRGFENRRKALDEGQSLVLSLLALTEGPFP
jgi:hypothetical protein